MRKALVSFNQVPAGILIEQDSHHYRFEYLRDYTGPAISLTMPVSQSRYEFNEFPAFFEGLLPEGQRLEAFLHHAKINRQDYFTQLVTLGADMVGAVTVKKYL